MLLVDLIYDLTSKFPSSEAYGLISQMRRAAVSIPSNIAEGRRRASRKDYRQFLIVAYSSGAELETQVEICTRIQITRHLSFDAVSGTLTEVMSMLNKMCHQLRS